MSTPLDPYTSQATNSTASPQEKIDCLKEIIKSIQTAMLTTRSSDGQLHSRAMNPVAPNSETDLNLTFFGNNITHKFDEIENDAHVNVSFCNPSTTSWVSYSGKARIIQDREAIKQHWSSSTSAWFGDLKDGVHKGDSDDPRVSIIEVIPEEIRYWYPTKGSIGRSVEIGLAAVTGKTASPGELRTITKNEIQLTQSLQTKN